MWTLRTTGGTDGNDATPTVLIIYEDENILHSEQG